MKNQFLETGKVVGTHGIRGEVRVQPWCDDAQFLTQFKKLYTDNEGKRQLKITASRVHGNIVLMTIQGVQNIADAENLRGTILYMDRNDVQLPQGAYFMQDLLDCSVYDADSGVLLGELSDVSKTGANDVWHVKKDGKEYLVPAIRDVVIRVDIDAQKIFLRPIKGIFDDAD